MVQSYVEHSATAQKVLKRFVKNRPISEHDLVELCDRGILKMDNGKPVFASELYKRYFTGN